MKRIITVVVVALPMAAMMVAMAMPVFAQARPCPPGEHPRPVGFGPGGTSFTCVPNTSGPPA